MNLTTLQERLLDLAPDADLVFEHDGGPIGDGFHVTEFKSARVQSIDCGGRRDDWTEATMQLLDGHGGKAMAVGRFLKILDQSIRAIPDLPGSPLRVEFGPNNESLGVYQIAEIVTRADRVTLRLGQESAVCKPLADVRRNAAPACCPPKARTQPACCA
ncbi:MAG: DUF6428 family protein [Pseudomonadota bacterium]